MATSSAGTALSRSGPRNFAVRWNDPSLFRMIPSSTKAAQGRKSARRVFERRYSARFIIRNSRVEMSGDSEVPTDDPDEVGVALGGPDRSHVADEPKQEASDPEAQTYAECRGERAVDDGDGARRTAHQDRFGQCAVNGRDEPRDLRIHQITTPPPNEKNDRKKLEAANAIDRPNTIWISLRNPPDVSPNASDNPVVIMMMTAMILATGPSTDCRIWLSGCSHGMLEPAASAGLSARHVVTNTPVETSRRSKDKIILIACPLL